MRLAVSMASEAMMANQELEKANPNYGHITSSQSDTPHYAQDPLHLPSIFKCPLGHHKRTPAPPCCIAHTPAREHNTTEYQKSKSKPSSSISKHLRNERPDHQSLLRKKKKKKRKEKNHSSSDINQLMAPVLLRLVVTFLFSAVMLRWNPILCSPNTLVLPLKKQTRPSGFSLPKVSSRNKRVNFSHNVTLTVAVTVGSPPQAVTMVLDTGSELSWLRCKKSPVFNDTFSPNRSRSYTPIPCSSPTCTTRTRDLINPVQCDSGGLCNVILSYADATSIEGNLAADTFRIGDASMPRTVFGCMDSGSSTNVGEDAKTTGLLGMNRGSLSYVKQMGFPKFSYCISGLDSSGVLLFGEAKFSWLKPLNYTPLVQMSTPLPYFNRVAYTLHLEGIKVSGAPLRISKDLLEPDHTGAGQTMVDSGTQFTFLLGPVYSALKAEFAKQVGGKLMSLGEPDFVFQGGMDLCYRVSGRTLPDLPTVALVFRGAEMSVSGERLLYRVPGMVRGSDSVYCFTFGNSDLLGMEAYVVGNHHQENVWMEFDLERSMVGIAQVRCDLASQQLGMTPQ